VLRLIAFSKDRPAQLDLLLRSVAALRDPAVRTAVVYTASDELYEPRVRAVREEHPGVTFADEREAGGFKAATLGLVAEAGDRVAFLVDDIVFTHRSTSTRRRCARWPRTPACCAARCASTRARTTATRWTAR